MKAKSLLLGLLFIGLGYSGITQKKDSKFQLVVITTSAQCEMCKDRIVEGLVLHKGVKKVDFNMETKQVKITYNGVKISEDQLREAISELGYSADDVGPAEDAYEGLPSCCKKPEDQ